MAAPDVQVSCEDFLEFQDALKKMRIIDDKIVYALNTSIPTESFKGQVDASKQCKVLYDELTVSYSQRDAIIKKCIGKVSENVRQLSEKREDLQVLKTLRKEQTKLRLMQSEVNIEEVVRDRSLKIFYERCRSAYKPPSLQL